MESNSSISFSVNRTKKGGIMKKILVVEDNDANFLLVEEILSDYRIKVTRAKNGSEFYKLLQDRTVFYSLILMDLMLPDTDGITLTKFIINNKLKIPIIFISAYTEKCEEIYDLGVEHFINKPVMPELLKSVIRKYIQLEAAVKQ
jgi:CheY-like chemotaxis protein